MASHEDRVRYWTQLVSEQKQSGLSVQDFCRERQISIHSYRGWRCRLNKDASLDGGWVTVKPGSEKAPSPAIALRIGAVNIDLRAGFDPKLLRDNVAALEPQC
jgi:hypothetical protein